MCCELIFLFWNLNNEQRTKEKIVLYVISTVHNLGPFRNETVFNFSTLVLFYEDFLLDFQSTTRELFSFLANKLPHTMATQAHACALHKVSQEGKDIKRNNSKVLSMLDPWNLMSKAFIAQACVNLTQFWVEEKWGPCGQFMSQKLRKQQSIPVVLSPSMCADNS